MVARIDVPARIVRKACQHFDVVAACSQFPCEHQPLQSRLWVEPVVENEDAHSDGVLPNSTASSATQRDSRSSHSCELYGRSSRRRSVLHSPLPWSTALWPGRTESSILRELSAGQIPSSSPPPLPLLPAVHALPAN